MKCFLRVSHFANFVNERIENECRLSERLRKVPPEVWEMYIIREIENTTPGSLREFSNFLSFEGNTSKLTDTNSKTLW